MRLLDVYEAQGRVVARDMSSSLQARLGGPAHISSGERTATPGEPEDGIMRLQNAMALATRNLQSLHQTVQEASATTRQAANCAAKLHLDSTESKRRWRELLSNRVPLVMPNSPALSPEGVADPAVQRNERHVLTGNVNHGAHFLPLRNVDGLLPTPRRPPSLLLLEFCSPAGASTGNPHRDSQHGRVEVHDIAITE